VSSAPSGIDVREYSYGVFSVESVAATTSLISARKNWLVTKIQFYAAAADVDILISPSFNERRITVKANGCLILEPNGAFKGTIVMFGSGGGDRLVVEYWFQALVQQGVDPTIAIDVVTV
jgi:hypothetical protein